MFVIARGKFTFSTILLIAVLQCKVACSAELIFFERGGCPWCARWEEEIGKIYPKTSEAQLLPLKRIDVGEAGKGDIALERPVRYTPTFVVVDRGREIGRITGYMDEGTFWGLLDKLAARIEDRPNRGD